MTLFAVYFHESDGYTYWCDVVLGIFDAQAKADELILQMVEKHAQDAGNYGRGNIDNYESYQFNINEHWPIVDIF